MEEVDILRPPLFLKTGQTKTRDQAYRDGDWLGTFNLWIVQGQPEPAIVYQMRSPQSTWAPGLLDVTAGGHYRAGEEIHQGMREVQEELGKTYRMDEVRGLGRKLYAGFNTDGTTHNNVVDIFMVRDDALTRSYRLQAEEVYGICVCPVVELLACHRDPSYQFTVDLQLADGSREETSVNSRSFPENYDQYHYKMAILVDRYFKGEPDILL
jgi:hypothetical protein